MSTRSVQLIYQAAIASYINPVYDAHQEAEAATVKETVALDEKGRPLSPIQRLEKYFSLIDKKNNKKVNATDLATAWVASISNPTENDLQLIAREIDRFMKQADIDNDGFVSLNEYIHYMLTLMRESQEGKRAEIHGLVAERAGGDPGLVDKLLEWFLEKDAAGSGEISVADFFDILANKIKLREKRRIEISEQVYGMDRITYAQYVLFMLGRMPTKVTLVFYDISTTATKNLSRILFGKNIQGIWHTSILAFGYEWWYGGDCFQSRPFSTPFGTTPTRTEDLGQTTRSLSELKEFVRSAMRAKYNYGSYDVITNNCNHFTNDLSQFLIHKGIRRSIVTLPGDLLNGGLARLLRPFLNKWLGNFRDEGGANTPPETGGPSGGPSGGSPSTSPCIEKDVVSQIRNEKWKNSEKESFATGDIALWKRTESDWVFCEIVGIAKDGRIRIKVFQNMKFKIKEIKSKSQLAKIPKKDLDEHETSINYLIALSILQSNRANNSDKALMRELTKGLIDGLIVEDKKTASQGSGGQQGSKPGDPSSSMHQMSIIIPDDNPLFRFNEAAASKDEGDKNCCSKCLGTLSMRFYRGLLVLSALVASSVVHSTEPNSSRKWKIPNIGSVKAYFDSILSSHEPLDDERDPIRLNDISRMSFAHGSGESIVKSISGEFMRIAGPGEIMFSPSDLARAWKTAANRRRSSLNENRAILLAKGVEQVFQKADLDSSNTIDQLEYLHYELVRQTESNERRRAMVLSAMASHCAGKSECLNDVLYDFVDKVTMNGPLAISVDDFLEMFAFNNKILDDSHREQVIDNAKRLERLCNTAPACIGYSDYILLMLGITSSSVHLAVYDITPKLPNFVNQVLFGKPKVVIYHTSIIAFEKEWFYGPGNRYRAEIGSLNFGRLTTWLYLGETHKDLEELEIFLRTPSILEKYSTSTYSLMHNNCNNFSDDLSVFLVNKRIPHQILYLPDELTGKGAAKGLRNLVEWSNQLRTAAESWWHRNTEESFPAVVNNLSEHWAVGELCLWKRNFDSDAEMYGEIVGIKNDRLEILYLKNSQWLSQSLPQELVRKVVNFDEIPTSPAFQEALDAVRN